METYQTLSLIGCIIGIFLMLFLFGIAGLGTTFNNMSPSSANHAENEALYSTFASGTAFSLVFFIALIPITFVIRNAKAVGIVLIVLGAISMLITRGWGIIPFALLLPAGIVVLREKKQVNNVVGR